MTESRAAADLPALRLKRNEDRRLNAGHLWIFSNEIDTAQTPLQRFQPGDVVRVLAHNDRALGLAYVNPRSLIAARMLGTWTPPDSAWLSRRLVAALALRERLYATPHYRLVYGEPDGLPGLVIDRYGEVCVAQIGTAGMERLKDPIRRALEETIGCSTVVFRNDGSSRELEGLPSYVETFGRPADRLKVIEDGLEFEAPLTEGQKTGWFFDQAANRRALGRYLPRGARVLDVFSYVGAWGVRAAHLGAREVLCVDSAEGALARAAANAQRNGCSLSTLKKDAFDALEDLTRRGERYDAVIVDPPAFAKRKKDVPKALAAYKRLNTLAARAVAGDGLLVSSSCSYHVSAEELQDAIGKGARAAERGLQILELGGQAPDHPIHPAIPETRYLKTFFCRVHDGLK